MRLATGPAVNNSTVGHSEVGMATSNRSEPHQAIQKNISKSFQVMALASDMLGALFLSPHSKPLRLLLATKEVQPKAPTL
jgi:hypothetical protein